MLDVLNIKYTVEGISYSCEVDSFGGLVFGVSMGNMQRVDGLNLTLLSDVIIMGLGFWVIIVMGVWMIIFGIISYNNKQLKNHTK